MTSAYLAWTYREIPITIANPSSTEGVQAWVNIYFYDGMDENGADIRFSDISGSALAYWIETKASTYFKVWVKLPASATAIYFYYGNLSAVSESSAESVFDLYDNFVSPTLDPNKWDPNGTGGSYSISDGILHVAGNVNNTTWQQYYTANHFAVPTGVFEFYVRTTSDNTGTSRRWLVGTYDAAKQNQTNVFIDASGNRAYGTGREGTLYNQSRTSVLTSYSKIKIAITGTTVKFYENDTLKATFNDPQTPLNPQGPWIGSRSSSEIVYVDWVRARKYVATEPTMSMVYPEWAYREIPIKVENPSSIDGVQSRIKIYIQPGMKSDGADIRFTDVIGTDLSYFIEGAVKNYIYVYVKLPANATKIHFYYGNPTATTTSSISNTFDFYEAWDAGSVDGSKWNTVTSGNGAIVQSGGRVRLSATAGYAKLSSKTTFNYPIRIIHFLTADDVSVSARHRFNINASFDVGLIGGKVYWNGATNVNYAAGQGYYIYESVSPSTFFDFALLPNKDTDIYVNSTATGVSASATPITLSVGDAGSTAASGDMSIYLTTVSKYVDPIPILTFDYSSWKKRENKIYVKNESTVDGVQCKLELPLLEGMKSDGADIRFSDIWGNRLPYFLEGYDENILKFIIKVPADTFIIYFHYGNSNATSESSGQDTFELFDDFQGGTTLDLTKWQGGSGYSIVNYDGNNALVLTGTLGNTAWISSKNTLTAPYILEYKGSIGTKSNNINFACHIHAANNTQSVGTTTGYLCSDMDNVNGGGFQLYKRDDANWWSLSNPSFTSYENVEYNVRIVAKTDGIEQYLFTDRGFLLASGSTADHLYTSGYVGFDVAGAGVSRISIVFARKFVATMPELVVIYDLEKLDPESIDITESTTSVYKQLTAKFPTNLVPPEQSRVIYYANGSDATNKLIFYGRIQTIDKTISSNGISVNMIAADDMKSFADQKVLWHYTKHGHLGTPKAWLDAMCAQTDLTSGFYSTPIYSKKSILFEIETTKYDAMQKILEYHRFIMRPYYIIDEANGVLPHEAVAVILPSDIDTNVDLVMPSPITFTYPSPDLADNPTIDPQTENYNKIIAHGNYTSAGIDVASIATTKSVFEGTETARDYVIKDDDLEEKDDVAEWVAIRWLLYFQAYRATVKFKLMDRVGLELWQRVKFGDGFSTELQRLTNQTQFEYVYVDDPNANDGTYGYYHPVSVSYVPRPSWLRISNIRFHKDSNGQYTEYEAITDFIVSSADPVVPSPYDVYVAEGMTKPNITDTNTIIKKHIMNTVNKRAITENGTVQASPAPTATLATVVTDSGKTVIGKTTATLTAGTRVLVVPDITNGVYYIST